MPSEPPLPPAPPIEDGLARLAESHDHLILDLWGVLHDGVRAYAHAVETLRRLRAAGKQILVLSNAPREVAVVREQMRRLGLSDDLYDLLMSSGQDVHDHLRERSDSWYQQLGRRMYHIGPERDHGIREGVDSELVTDIEAADFLLVTGPPEPDKGLVPWEPVLDRAAERRLPLICANPDVVVMRGDTAEMCAGALARRYEELGGEVRYHGKPTTAIYRTCFAMLGEPDPARVMAVGDSLPTDIAGATAAGIAGVLVTGGIHAGELGVRMGEAPDSEAVARLCDAKGIWPSAAIPAFRW